MLNLSKKTLRYLLLSCSLTISLSSWAMNPYSANSSDCSDTEEQKKPQEATEPDEITCALNKVKKDLGKALNRIEKIKEILSKADPKEHGFHMFKAIHHILQKESNKEQLFGDKYHTSDMFILTNNFLKIVTKKCKNYLQSNKQELINFYTIMANNYDIIYLLTETHTSIDEAQIYYTKVGDYDNAFKRNKISLLKGIRYR